MGELIRINRAERRAWLGERPLTLTVKEFDFLALLADRVGTVVTREQIMRDVWRVDWWNSTKTLDMHMSWLRRKLGDPASAPTYIRTVRGVGFLLEPGTVAGATPTAEREAVTRIFLVRPGDVLVIGGLGEVSERVTATAASLRDQLRLADVALFPGDIDLAVAPGGDRP